MTSYEKAEFCCTNTMCEY